MSTFERQERQLVGAVNHRDEGIEEAIRNCQSGNYCPNDEWGLEQILQFIRYSPGNKDPFDPDQLFTLEHDFQLSSQTILKWIAAKADEEAV